MNHDHDEIYNRGLAFDLSTLLERRRVLTLFGAAGFAALAGCASTSSPSASTPTTAAAPTAAATATGASVGAGTCEKIPQETAGPYPGDGSNGPNVLTQSGIVRSDITSSFGASTNVAKGIPLTINLSIQDSKACGALAGAAVYLWHCDREGNYSMYSQSVTNENYLRGVQEADGSGKVTFKSIFPAAYSGRWPHIHFEIYPNLAAATSAGSKLATSQLAFPADVCNQAYTVDGYSASVQNMKRTTLQNDNVFSDGVTHQLATVTGDQNTGYTATLSVPV